MKLHHLLLAAALTVPACTPAQARVAVAPVARVAPVVRVAPAPRPAPVIAPKPAPIQTPKTKTKTTTSTDTSNTSFWAPLMMLMGVELIDEVGDAMEEDRD